MQVYAELLADVRSIAPTRSKVEDDDDLDFEPATRPASRRPGSPRSLAAQQAMAARLGRPISTAEYVRLAVDDNAGPPPPTGERSPGAELGAGGGDSKVGGNPRGSWPTSPRMTRRVTVGVVRFSEVLYIVNSYSKYTVALTLKKFVSSL